MLLPLKSFFDHLEQLHRIIVLLLTQILENMPQVNVTVAINESIYLKNPLETALGKKILEHAIILLDEIGFENFNFKKLAIQMESTEASVYRYFENKYKLLAYLVAWYWDYMHYIMLFDSRNISDPRAMLNQMVETLVFATDTSVAPSCIALQKLHNIILENGLKVYHNKQVDYLKDEGFFVNYRKLVSRLADVVSQIDVSFMYPKMLATTIIETSLNYEYYLLHLPNLTDSPNTTEIESKAETLKAIRYLVKRVLGE